MYKKKRLFNFRTPSEWFKEYDPNNVTFDPAVMPPVKIPQRIPTDSTKSFTFGYTG